MFRVAVVLVTAVLALGVVDSAEAAAPRLVMLSGEPLTDPILISDAERVFALYQSFFQSQPVERAALKGRRSLRLGLFWNDPVWEPYVRQPAARAPARAQAAARWSACRRRRLGMWMAGGT
jgi:hypothetical protein